MAEGMDNELNAMQQENSLINQIVLSEDNADGESSQLLMNNIILQQNALGEETESFPLLENTGTACKTNTTIFQFNQAKLSAG